MCRSKPLHATAVFLGPSMPRREARTLLDAAYYPPACKGDIFRISASGVRTIVLIDGLFHNTPSIWPREILDALDQGIRVFGASSMGALRAAELHRFGMVGYGTIFEWYRDGLIDGDDEVALWHGPEETSFCPLSEPLVNIRATLQKASDDSCITRAEGRELLEYAKQTYYPERSYQQLLTCPALQAWPGPKRAALERYLLTKAIDLKRLDAIGVLRHCAKSPEQEAPTITPNLLGLKTDFWQLDRMLSTGLHDSGEIRLGEELLEEAEKDPALLADMWTPLSTRAFLLEWARQNQISPPEELLRVELQQWETSHDITNNGDWLEANGLTMRSCRSLLAERVLIDWLTIRGPAQFGLPWNLSTSVRNERLPLAAAMPGPRSSEQASLPAAGPAPAHSKRPADLDGWTKASQRGFLADWARQNGVSCPPDVLRRHLSRAETAQATQDVDARSAMLAQEALTSWMVEQGPHYFGVDWSFECALLGELQITGMAARLLARAHGE